MTLASRATTREPTGVRVPELKGAGSPSAAGRARRRYWSAAARDDSGPGNGFPIVEQFDRQGMRFLMGAALVRFAGGAQRRQLRCVLGGQIDRGPSLSRAAYTAAISALRAPKRAGRRRGPLYLDLSQAAGFADQMCPAAEPVRVMAVRRPAIAHQPAGEAVQHVLKQFLAGVLAT